MGLTKTQSGGLEDQSVTLDKLPHGDGSSDGKFLRANNGADPTFETVPAGGISNVVEDTSPQLGGNLASNGNNILFADGDTAKFGAGNDLNLYHNGTDSYVQNTTGTLRINNDGDDLVISTDNNIHIRTNGTEEAVKAIANGAVELYHDNSKKFETRSDGIAVWGTEGGDAQLRLTADEGDDGADYWRLESKASDNNFNLATYASGAWVNKATVTSAGRVGIGTASPDQSLHVYHGTDNGLLHLESGDSQARIKLKDNVGQTHIGAVGSDTVMWQGSGLAETLRLANGGEVTKPRTPFFWAYNSSNYGWNHNTISFETEANDVGGNYNNSTYTFTCPTAGIYMFIVYFRSGGSFSEFSWELQKNGGNFVRIIGQGSYSGNDVHFGTTMQACSNGDTWRVYGSGNHGGATGGYQYNGFQGYLLG